MNYYSAEGEEIEDILLTAARPYRQPLLNTRLTFAARTLHHVRLLQGAISSEVWSIGELKFFLGEREVAIQPEWRAAASTFTWDIGLALDGNRATRWRAWEPSHPGMWIDIDFHSAVTLDRIEVYGSQDQRHLTVSLRDIDAKREVPDAPAPEDLRRAATATIKRRGIDYLLIAHDYALANDIESDPARWGLTKVAERGANQLLKID